MNFLHFRLVTSGTIGLISVTVAASRAPGGTIKVVSPAANQDTDGNAEQRPGAQPLRIQHLIPASDFAGLPDTHRLLIAFNFRSDRSQTQSVDWTTGPETIWMSTTDRNELTNVFEDNHGPNKTMVHDGDIPFPLLGTGPAAGPRDIADGPRLQTPFYYDPSQGNLLIDRFITVDNPSPRANIDTYLSPVERTLLNDQDPNSPTGTLFPEHIVVQFEFAAIPEPSTLVLVGVGVMGLGLLPWRQKRRHESVASHP